MFAFYGQKLHGYSHALEQRADVVLMRSGLSPTLAVSCIRDVASARGVGRCCHPAIAHVEAFFLACRLRGRGSTTGT